MPKSSGRSSCSDCAYWQPYPLMKGTGTCENTDSPNYSRALVETTEQCESFETRPIEPTAANVCGECNYWGPVDILPSLGECYNPTSTNFEKSVLRDKVSGVCFEVRSLEGLEFAWCGTCRSTLHTSELNLHTNHKLFERTSQFPVEDMMELTSAAD